MNNWVYIDQGYQKAEQCIPSMSFNSLLTVRHYGDGAGTVSTTCQNLSFLVHSQPFFNRSIHKIYNQGFYFTGKLTGRYYGDGTGSVREPGIKNRVKHIQGHQENVRSIPVL